MNIFRLSCLIAIIANFGITVFLISWRDKKKSTATTLFGGMTFGGGIWGIGTFMFSNLPKTSYDLF